MPVTFQEILDSRISTYIIGEVVDGTVTEFHVHDETIAQLSMKLRDVVKGGCKVWKDVSKKTFGRFVQFAYLEDYSVQGSVKAERKREMREFESENETLLVQDTAQESYWFGVSSKKSKKKKKKGASYFEEMAPEVEDIRPGSEVTSKSTPPAGFHELAYEPSAPRNNYAETCKLASTFQADHTYTPVFLSHAALFHHGEIWDIDSLKSLALYKL